MRRDACWVRELSALEGDRRRAMEFLRDHLPDSDLDCYPFSLFLRFAHHALALREAAPWCGALEWEIFAHYVLFPRVNDEDLSFHRALFHASLWPRVKDLPAAEDRVLEANRWCCEHASYEAQDERTASPLTVYRCGSGRCGEESAFLVSALRSVGIPARQVYAPRWAHCGDNHAWVEALCDGTWRFLGACEPEPVLDRGWFNTAASRAVLVHSRLFGSGSSPLHGAPLGREGGVSWFNQTSRYARTHTAVLRALLDGRPAAGAVFEVQLLNDGFFHTIAVLTADGAGQARVELGLGSVHVLARLGSLAAEGDCEGDALTLELASLPAGDSGWTDFDVRAPEPDP
ncbi:MAG: transglutaminase-like domain-containing protein, partial [Oscillospiraceae bacterium]|nr:transglutaminase-like domain-containing protein [Oscillospiraceae bacterium]